MTNPYIPPEAQEPSDYSGLFDLSKMMFFTFLFLFTCLFYYVGIINQDPRVALTGIFCMIGSFYLFARSFNKFMEIKR